MPAAGGRRRKRARGGVETLPSGALRVRVYAGIDPVTGRRHYLREIIPAGPHADDQADEALARLRAQVREQRHPRTNATLNQLLDRHLEMIEAERTTLATYRGYIDKHIRPLIGHQKVGALDADILDSFYAELRRCRSHCRGRRGVQHRSDRPHACDLRCRRHVCRPLSAWTIRKIHFIISGAYQRAVRWKWVTINPAPQAEPPSAPPPDPRPPTADEAARIVAEAWKNFDFGTLVWLAMMTTGARRGELCALRWPQLDRWGRPAADRRIRDGHPPRRQPDRPHDVRGGRGTYHLPIGADLPPCGAHTSSSAASARRPAEEHDP